MKAALYDLSGKHKSDIELPELFSSKIREDIAGKYNESEKFILAHPYSHDPRAGRKHSASGTISHRRHEWKGHYGKGISRVPRKAMYRRGTQFFWIGAEVSSTRGGRRVHGPVLFKRIRKVNSKEVQIAMNSAFAATASKNYILKRYASLSNLNIHLPIIVESKLDNMKAKDLVSLLSNIFKENSYLVFQNKEVRAGKGKRRGRKYKSNAGLLLIKGKDEVIKSSAVEVKSIGDVSISDLYPLGRLAVYTQKAIQEIGGKR